MLFNSYFFILVFLPVAVTLSVWSAKYGRTSKLATLILVSLFFYGWWDIRYLLLLVPSILLNYALGQRLSAELGLGNKRSSSLWLAAGVIANLSVLGIFKYSAFFAQNFNAMTGAHLLVVKFVLPLGISFFTFEQIGYLIDIKRGHHYRADLLGYAFFVSFFPRLVAGPILRFSEIEPQVLPEKKTKLDPTDLAVGLIIFSIGLCKKSFLADSIAPHVGAIFANASSGQAVDFFLAWGGALAYTCQLYFDFSGYSDMAIGAARCFGIRFPANFNSPYKAGSIVEFWRRWHITLSRFLRDYLYISLGGNRRGTFRRYLNLFVTMLLGGLWHGANWTFVCWGALHGLYLMINHGWDRLSASNAPVRAFRATFAWRAFAHFLTFMAVVVAWVFFRSTDFTTAGNLLAGMFGLHGASLPNGLAPLFAGVRPLMTQLGIEFGMGSSTQIASVYGWIFALLLIAFAFPNTQQLLHGFNPILSSEKESAAAPSRISWRFSPYWAVIHAAIAFFGLISITRVSEFLYWQF